MIFKKEDKMTYENSLHCSICGDELDKFPNGYRTLEKSSKIQPEKKVRDHCHITGNLRSEL
jgi:hypothetical protein